MIKRTYNADFINSVINHPSVREGAEVKGVLDASATIANLRNFVLVNEFGGFVVIKLMDGLYECHTQFLPEGRGQLAVDAVNEACHYMFTKTDCTRIVTKVNVNNRATRLFTGSFFRRRGIVGDYYYYSLDIEDWIERSPDCVNSGIAFHNLIEDTVNHEPDATHDSYAGAAMLMAKNKNIYKGQTIYNRWAVMSGYEPIVVLSEFPLIVQCGGLKLAIDEEVMICQ